MKTMKKLTALAIGFLLVMGNTYAKDTKTKDTKVTGYRNIKFGMSKAEVLKTKICTLRDSPPSPELTGVICEDFEFAERKTILSVYFMEDKAVRVAITVPEGNFVALIDSIVDKYGKPLPFNQKEMHKALDTKGLDFWINWDVGVGVLFSNAGKLEMYLTYSVLDYSKRLNAIKKENLKDSL